jgi:putative DNA primase/helicase
MFQETPKYVGEFFDAVLGERTGFVSIGSTSQSSLGTCSYRFFSADDSDAISDHINSLPKDSQVLFGLGRLESIPAEGRGKSEDVIAFSALAMDIDLDSAKKEHQNLPKTLNEAVELIQSFTLPPSIVVKSGTGLHAYWLLHKDVLITNQEERDQAKKLVANFHQGVNEFFAPTEFDHTQDIARVMRAPGFVNLKNPSAQLPVEILSMDTSVRYSLEEIISVSASRSRSKKPFRINPPAGKVGELNFDRMVAGCKWLERSVSNKGVTSHDAWFATGSLMSLTEDGSDRFHAWSAGSPDYDYEVTQAKYDQIDPDKARRSCSSLASIQYGELCEGCVFAGGIQSPAELGESGTRAIHASGQQLPVLTAELWAAVHVKNEPSRIFARNGLLARVNEELGLIEVLDENSARHTFARVGLWVHPSKDQDGWGSHSLPNVAIIKDALATPFPPVPSLNQVTLVPVLTEHGKILDAY